MNSTKSIEDYGAKRNTLIDTTPFVVKALSDLSNNDTLVFPNGYYHFYPNSQHIEGIPFVIDGKDTFTVEGGNSSFICHGQMGVMSIQQSSNVTFGNVNIEWERAFVVQAEVEASTEQSLILQFDITQYPVFVENRQLKLRGETINGKSETYKIASYNCNLYDGNNNICVGKGDSPIGVIISGNTAENLGYVTQYPSLCRIRFTGTLGEVPSPGTKVVMQLEKDTDGGLVRSLDALNIVRSSNTHLKNINICHSLGRGIAANKSTDIEIDHCQASVNIEKKRCFSTRYGNAVFNNCKGNIYITSCLPTGMGDDAINIHGRYYKIDSKLSSNTVIISTPDAAPEVNDKIWIVDKETMRRKASLTVSSVKDVSVSDKMILCRIEFSSNIPSGVWVGDYAENETWTPSVNIRFCTFSKKNRARGILVTTPKDVIISNNTFETAGSSILIAGDIGEWRESGGTNDITIKGNEFINCLTSGNNVPYGGWGEAIIAIKPAEEALKAFSEQYHKKVTIKDNTFSVLESVNSISVYARSLGSLICADNTTTYI